MQFADYCFITEDVPRLARFYEAVFGAKADGDAVHSALQTPGAGIAIYQKSAAEADMGFDFSRLYGRGALTINYNVDDVDAEFTRLSAMGVEMVTQPKTWPWGARSFFFRDPDGNIMGFRTVPKRG